MPSRANMDPKLESQLLLVKSFFEEMFGCVVGCGCWEPGWDNESAIAGFAREGFAAGWKEPVEPRVVLEALNSCFTELRQTDMGEAQRILELHLERPEDFRSFFGDARERLAQALKSEQL